MTQETGLDAMLAEMSPWLQPGLFVFCSVLHGSDSSEALSQAHAMMAEDEGLSLILPRAEAQRLGLKYDRTMRQITLMVFANRESVGLTATVARALAERGIAANVVAAAMHDHIFVPAARADDALDTLRDVQKEAQRRLGEAKGGEG